MQPNDLSMNPMDDKGYITPKEGALIMEREKEVETDMVSEMQETRVRENHFALKIYKSCRITIYKPFVPIKLMQMLWFAAAHAMASYLPVFLKQKGMTLAEITLLFTVSAVAQGITPTICGIIADKLGRSKPVLIITLVLSLVGPFCLLFTPKMTSGNCQFPILLLECQQQELNRIFVRTSCQLEDSKIQVHACKSIYSGNAKKDCFNQSSLHRIVRKYANETWLLTFKAKATSRTEDECVYEVESFQQKNQFYSLCELESDIYCKISCSLREDVYCLQKDNNRYGILIKTFMLVITLLTMFSNVFRFLDITIIANITDHRVSFFGKERFWAMIGVIIGPAAAGWLVHSTSSSENDINYIAALYLVIALIILTLVISWNANIRVKDPSKKMWEKSIVFLRNPDIFVLIPILVILGASWGFSILFRNLYMEQFEIPNYFLGLLFTINGLYSLPFLYTSEWWIKRIGCTNIIVLAFIAHAICFFGYSLLKQPWIAVILEITSVFHYHLLWVAVMELYRSRTPKELSATVCAIAGVLHYNLGRASGSLIGGIIFVKYGARTAYAMMGTMCLILAVLYEVYLYFWHICPKKPQQESE